MRRPFLGLVAALALVCLAPPGQAFAQLGGTGGGYDVFSFYYGYYLPHQAYIAAQPTPLDTLNQVTAQRQYAAQTDRSALYDPISPYGDEEDPFSPYGGRKKERTARSMGRGSAFAGNAQGNGPGMYYNRAAQYFPGMKSGRGPNQNLARTRGARFSGGGMGGAMGMPSMGMGMPR